jgi:hypothetical protein
MGDTRLHVARIYDVYLRESNRFIPHDSIHYYRYILRYKAAIPYTIKCVRTHYVPKYLCALNILSSVTHATVNLHIFYDNYDVQRVISMLFLHGYHGVYRKKSLLDSVVVYHYRSRSQIIMYASYIPMLARVLSKFEYLICEEVC